MYPSGELNGLAARKEFLRARIAVRRAECAQAAHQIARPIALIDRGLERWRRISPIVRAVGLPLALMLLRKFMNRRHPTSKWSTISQALPTVMRAVREFAKTHV
jgi:hypothetical protein